ncbi:ankyrin repeat domain-containing protein 11 isoform X2 [Pieris napi]|uniref:ankyrin repeat domain-containing protein 11 isoform X2 n=1 Tax=Pieris napi TaxID=78633 RepID=UPI001FBAB067|nr:ankyrin repeat domain-containing protein 11 isoform X2 [Pieris napi]
MPSTSRSRGSGRASDAAPRTQVIAPMSERQQLALVMQISSQDAPPAAPTPAEERKRTRQQRNERGETPLHVAAIRGDHDQVKKLLEQGQDPDVTDFAGWTPLHEACSYGWFQVVVVLVNGGANVNAKGLDDDTPLHDAATSGNLEMVKFLIEHSAEPFVKNTKGKAPSDYAAPHIYDYIISLKDNNARASHTARTRDDSNKKSGNASTNSEGSKRTNMEGLAQGEIEGKEATPQEKEGSQLSSGVVSSTQDDTNLSSKKGNYEESQEADTPEDDVSKRKKRKETEEKEPMAKPAPVARTGTGRKPGPASKTGALPLSKGGASPNVNKSAATSSTGKAQATGKGASGNKGKTGSGKTGLHSGKQDRRSPVASPKPGQSKDDGESEDKPQEAMAPKVPPLKIVIPGGAGGSGNRNEQEEGVQRGGGKGRGSASTLPYVIPCTTDTAQTSDSSDGNSDDKRVECKGGQRVLRSHRTNDADKDKGNCPHSSDRSGSNQILSSHKNPLPGADDAPSTSGGRNESDGPGSRGRRYHSPLKSPKSTRQSYGPGGRGRRSTHKKSAKKRGHSSTAGHSADVHPRKRKIKASKESHSREPTKSEHSENIAHNVTHSNPYQMYIHKRKQIERRQKTLFPVKPKPPKDFNKYLMNRCTYTLQNNVNPEPQVDIPINMPQQMVTEFLSQERERTRLRVQHQVEKEKLVLAVEQEILRVHGRAERAVANQALPFSVCTILRDKEVYNVLAPDQEEKRNAQRSRCNGRQINSWLQEVDDKWEKIKEGMLRRQHTEAETLHAVQTMGWEWKLKELGLCDHKNTPKIDPTHVPQIHVSNFDLPA